MANRFKALPKVLSFIWTVLILAMGLFCARALIFENILEFNLMDLLPESKSQPFKVARQMMEDEGVSNQFLLLVGHEDQQKGKSALLSLEKNLQKNLNLIQQKKTKEHSKAFEDFSKEIFPYRNGFLSVEDRALLERGEFRKVLQKTISAVFQPFSLVSSKTLESDPFLLFFRFLKSLTPSTSFKLDDDDRAYIKSQQKVWYMYHGEIHGNAFSLDVQKKVKGALEQEIQKIEDTGVHVLRTGAIFYAIKGAEQANKEVNFIGMLSLLFIGILIFVVFRSPRPLFLALLIVGSGLAVGFFTTFLVFGSVHILSLVFGSTLMGVAVDYALHYSCATVASSDPSRWAPLRTLMPALPLSLLSSIVGYIFLLVPPFSGIRQMAVFGASGILGAFISVCLWGPIIIKNRQNTELPVAKKMMSLLLRISGLIRTSKAKCLFSLGCFTLFTGSLFFMNVNNDVRLFQAPDPALKYEEMQVQEMMRFYPSQTYVVLIGYSLQEVLEKEEKVTKFLDALMRRGGLEGYKAFSQFVPSNKAQEYNRDLVKRMMGRPERKAIEASLRIEIPEDTFSNDLNYDLSVEDLEKLPSQLKGRVKTIGQKISTIIQLNDPKEIFEIEQFIKEIPGVFYVDIVSKYTDLFSSYLTVILAILGALFAIVFLMFSLWKGARRGGRVLMPAGLSIMLTLAATFLFEPFFNIFHAMGLVLVFCIGMDYTFFLYWAPKEKNLSAPKKHQTLLLANFLAAMTTIFSFGFLAFSQTRAIHSFGFTVFTGITLNLFITTILLGRNREENDQAI